MNYFLQAGFGDLLGAETLNLVKSLGFDGVRIGMDNPDRLQAQACVREVLDAGLAPYVVVLTYEQALDVPPGIDIEYLNEPDLTSLSPEAYAANALSIQEARGQRLWAVCISNLNNRGFDYLRRVLAHAPELQRISVHRYPRASGNPHQPQKGFSSRIAEVEALKQLIGARSWGVSEFGYSTGKDAWWRRRATDYEVACRVEWEWRFWSSVGAEFATLYQINDGPENVRLDRYGIRRRTPDNTSFHGPLKNVAHSVLRVKAETKA